MCDSFYSYLMCMDGLTECMSVYYMHSVLVETRKDIGFPETGVRESRN